MEILVEDLDEVVDGLQVGQVVVTNVHTNAEIKSSIPPVNDFETTKLQEDP
jgi:hypothetical protein